MGLFGFQLTPRLNCKLFAAHHGRESNTVLRSLTKKPSLQHLNWRRALREKSSCLDNNDPTVQDLPHPADNNWGVRSDLFCDIKNRNHPRKLTEEKQLHQQEEPLVRKSDTVNPKPGLSGQLYQRTGDRNLQWYRKLTSTVKSTSNHTITLSKGVVLRKLAVALSKKTAKKVPVILPQPPTPKVVKQKELKKRKAKVNSKITKPRNPESVCHEPPIPTDKRISESE